MSTQERSVILKAHEVRGILEGRQNHIRRIVKPQPESAWGLLVFIKKDGYWLYPNAKDEVLASAPLGKPGDRVWVKETYFHTRAEYEYCISVSIPYLEANTIYAADLDCGVKGARFTPSSQMPRELSRITLEITDVRVEQVDGTWVWVYDVRRCA